VKCQSKRVDICSGLQNNWNIIPEIYLYFPKLKKSYAINDKNLSTWEDGLQKLVSCTVFHSKQELLGQFSSTVEQKLYHWEGRNNDGKINLKFKSKETNKIRGKN
jgi:hypothetical protein